jgi:hypothetical protein
LAEHWDLPNTGIFYSKDVASSENMQLLCILKKLFTHLYYGISLSGATIGEKMAHGPDLRTASIGYIISVSFCLVSVVVKVVIKLEPLQCPYQVYKYTISITNRSRFSLGSTVLQQFSEKYLF